MHAGLDARIGARIQQAWFYYERRRWSDALEACRAALGESPEAEEALYLGGHCCLHLGDAAGARQMAEALLGVNPASPGGHELMGLILGDAGETLRAERYLREALRLDPRQPTRYATLASLLGRHGRVEEGITIARRGMKLDPKCVPVLRTLQMLYRLNDEPERAREFGELALRVNPEDAGSHLELGLAWLEARRPEKARASFLDSLRIDPVSGDSMEAIAHEKVRTHRFFRNGLMLPVEPKLMAAMLVTPLCWWALSLAFRPFVYACWVSGVVLAIGYARSGAFYLCRWIALRRLREGRL